MIPTLLGRWQTRFFLIFWIGGIVTLPFALFLGVAPFGNLALVFGLGVLWDILYILIQKLRWDRDWPFAFQFGSGITEGIFLFATGILPLTGSNFLHYSTVFFATFFAVFGPLKTLYPAWRYRGGQFLGR